MKKALLFTITLLAIAAQAGAKEISMKITKNYLNLPVSGKAGRAVMAFGVDGVAERSFVIRLASAEADYWVFSDVSNLKGKTVTISYEGDGAGLKNIYQADTVAGEATIYREANRPQLHFSARRGWINDPNGLIFYDGEYHLFFQHNPYEREWENMHWGHAVSSDLVHWKELPEALYPDRLGTMFSGSAVIDYGNTAGFNKDGKPAMIAAYTANSPDRQVQCIAYSLDRGRTWTKYAGNPVINSKEKWDSHDTRDPKVFWYAPNGEWVMVLNERDGHSVYTSANLKEWKFESHINGFWECPELFPLPVDGDAANRKWVMYGASGAYLVGRFDGKKFTPESKLHYTATGHIYAAQTYNNIPASDGRRIQIGWGRGVPADGMPFNGIMLLPTELTLRTTKEGVRLFSVPIRELESLQTGVVKHEGTLSAAEAGRLLRPYSDEDCMRLKFRLKLFNSNDAGLSLYGRRLVDYNMASSRVNGTFYAPEDMDSLAITADVIIDRTCVEVFIDGGAYSFSIDRRPSDAGNREGFRFWGQNVEISNLELYEMASVWE